MIREARAFIIGALVGAGVGVAQAALTNAQIFEHLGRMINRGFAQGLVPAFQERVVLQTFGIWGEDYVINGSSGTVADRKEAMQAVFRQVFLVQKGLDGTVGLETDGTAPRHYYKRHWLPGEVGLSTRAVNALEP